MKCKNCGEPIHKVPPLEGGFLHDSGNVFRCGNVLPNTPLKKCHICGTVTDKHGMFCSAVGTPHHWAEVDTEE